MTDDLITWLRTQLDDDERAIRRIAAASCHGIESTAEKDYFRFVDRAPAEVNAKRRILDLHQPENTSRSDQDSWGAAPVVCAGESWECYGDGAEFVDWPCAHVRLLALPYSDRPGYREEWRP